MRGCVAAVSLLLLLAPAAQPQCTFPATHSLPFRASYLDVAVQAGELWAATAYGVELFDRSADPPLRVASLALPGTTRLVRPSGGVTYAGSGTSIFVLRRSGAAIENIRSIDAGATINDMLVTPLALYAATASGLQQYDLLNPLQPVRTPGALVTSGSNVTSLSIAGSTLYAADGDETLEAFDISSPSLPQRLTSIPALSRSTAVEATNTRLYVSDGIQTEIFARTATPVRASRIPIGVISFVAHAGEVAFVAGGDRRLRAVDFAVAETPVELFATEIAPTGGTINRFFALQVAGGRLYAAAGDGGMLTFDVATFASPYPVRSYANASSTSVFSLAGKLYTAGPGGGIYEYSMAASGQLTSSRQWDTRVHRVHDGANGFLLTSTGSTLIYWTVASSSPIVVSSVALRAPVVSAVVAGTTAFTVLHDRTIWSADLSQEKPAAQQIALTGIRPSFVARSDSSLTIADLREDGNTAISYFATPDLTRLSGSATVPGVATGLTMSNGKAAVFTYAGASIADFNTGVTTVLPQSNTAFARLTFAGQSLVVATERTVSVWDLATRTRLREVVVPAEPLAIHTAAETHTHLAGIATAEGVMSVVLTATSSTPRQIGKPPQSAFYKKVVATASRLYLFDGRTTDVFATGGGIPTYVSSVRDGGAIDIAATEERLFTLTNNGTVTSRGRDGDLVAQTRIDEGADALPLAIDVAGGAPWISISRGCLSGGCEKKTLVLDPLSLATTATMTGGIVKVTVSSSRAYALTDLPGEIRIINVADPLHPTVISSRATEGTPPPVAVAYAAGEIHVLGEKLYSYSEATFARTSERFGSYVPAAEGGTAYVDQRIAIVGGCAVVTSRAFSPQVFSLPQFAAVTTLPAPSVVRSVATAGDRLYVLTDHSIEVWSATPLLQPSRRRATR